MDETKIIPSLGQNAAHEQQVTKHIPIIFGNYNLQSELGQGAMGKVYKAVHRHLKRVVALKIPTNIKNDTEMKRFLREAETMAQLQHPNIIHIHEVGCYKNQPYLTMDFIDGQELSSFYRNNSLSSRQVANMMITICEAIHYAHSNGIVHRDLKPANIMIKKDGSPVIMDFGLAKKFDDHQLSQSGMIVGTLTYMSPEQAQGKNRKIDERSDIYSLGVILYELLTGRPPFISKSSFTLLHDIVKTQPILLRDIKSIIPKEIESICLKAMAKNPEERYQTAQDFAKDLKNFIEEKTISAKAPKVGKLTLQKNKNFAIIFGTLLVISTFAFLVVERYQLQEINNKLGKENLSLREELLAVHNGNMGDRLDENMGDRLDENMGDRLDENMGDRLDENQKEHFSLNNLSHIYEIDKSIKLKNEGKCAESIYYLQKYFTENFKKLSDLEKGEFHYQIGLLILQQNLEDKYAKSYYYFDKQVEFVLPLYYAQKIADDNIKHLGDGCFHIGEIFLNWGLKDAAWAYLEKATIIDESNVSSYVKLAEAFLQLDIHLFAKERKQDIANRTILAIEKGRKLYPDNTWLKATYGKILGTRLHGTWEEGITLIEEAIKDEQDSYWMHLMIAEIYKQLENVFPDKKIEYCQKRYEAYQNAEKFLKNEDPTWGYLGSIECAEILGKPIDKHVEQLLQLIDAGRLPEYLKQQVYEKKLFLLKHDKNLQEMDKIYDQLANISNVNAEKFYDFAQLCKETNNIEMAKKYYAIYLQKIGDIKKINSTINFLKK